MSIGEDVARNLPYLRRYARALTGAQHEGDAYVRATLEAALEDDALLTSISDRVGLYAAFNKIWASAQVPVTGHPVGDNLHEVAAQAHLARMTPLSRQALLLTTLEDFSSDDAARVMGLDRAHIDSLVNEAVSDIENESSTSVLIIEDEPLISMQLEQLVEGIGHRVCGTAATRRQALEIVAEQSPGLVLADIQLADGSSGIDAVADILAMGEVPVIFITAYPEKLLTGERQEPTYLVTKPFQEATVRAAISQALFFGSSRPISA